MNELWFVVAIVVMICVTEVAGGAVYLSGTRISTSLRLEILSYWLICFSTILKNFRTVKLGLVPIHRQLCAPDQEL
jgi:hypothetical protein